MKKRGEGLKESIEKQLVGAEAYYYTAFMSCLCLPDICGYLDNGSLHSKPRYMKWFQTYASEYMGNLTAEEAYAMRCVILHNGSTSTDQYLAGSPNSSIILDKYVLTVNNSSHMNRFNNCSVDGVLLENMVVFNVTNYCHDMLRAVSDWELKNGKKLDDYDQVFKFHDGSLDLGFVHIS